MKLQWQTIWHDAGNGKHPIFLFEEPYSLLGTLLVSDVQSDGLFLSEALESVRSGQTPMKEITGNVCSVLIGRERIVILDALAADGMGKACVVDFGEFNRILEAWLVAVNAS